MTDEQFADLMTVLTRIAVALEAVAPPPRLNPNAPHIQQQLEQLVDDRIAEERRRATSQ